MRRYLQGYAEGVPVGTERDLFEKFVEEIRATDAQTAEHLGPALREIAAAPSGAAGIASKALAKLPKKTAGDAASP